MACTQWYSLHKMRLVMQTPFQLISNYSTYTFVFGARPSASDHTLLLQSVNLHPRHLLSSSSRMVMLEILGVPTRTAGSGWVEVMAKLNISSSSTKKSRTMLIFLHSICGPLGKKATFSTIMAKKSGEKV